MGPLTGCLMSEKCWKIPSISFRSSLLPGREIEGGFDSPFFVCFVLPSRSSVVGGSLFGNEGVSFSVFVRKGR